MLETIPHFLMGVAFGAVFGFTWDIHKIGKILIVGLLFVAVGFIAVYPAEFVASFAPWPFELANFIGIMVGSYGGKQMSEEMKES